MKLSEIDASFTDRHETHEQAGAEIGADLKKLGTLQFQLYAENKRRW